MRGILGREDEGGLGIVELPRDLLERLFGQAGCVGDDGEGIAAEGGSVKTSRVR